MLDLLPVVLSGPGQCDDPGAPPPSSWLCPGEPPATVAAGDEIVYDNQMGSSDDSDDAIELGGGSIVIHSGGNGNG